MCRIATAAAKSEQGDLVRVSLRRSVVSVAQDPMSGCDSFDVAGLLARPLAFGERCLEAIEGVSDMLKLAVQLVAMAIKEVLKAFEQIGGEVGSKASRVAVGSDGVEPVGHQRAVPMGRAKQAPAI